LGSEARASDLAGSIAREISETPAIEANHAICTDHREIKRLAYACIKPLVCMCPIAVAKAKKADFIEKPMARSGCPNERK
jgi:hypothetical protein